MIGYRNLTRPRAAIVPLYNLSIVTSLSQAGYAPPAPIESSPLQTGNPLWQLNYL
jgi:hypothetical protein